MKIIVGVDGSEASHRALEWCAANAKTLAADVVAVFALEIPVFPDSGFGVAPIPAPVMARSDTDRAELLDKVEHQWCSPLADAGVTFRAMVIDGLPAPVIMALAAKEAADLVVTGRRGRGGFAELLLGSTSHQLAHHLDRPLVIVP